MNIPKVKFSNNLAKGSIIQRYETARQLNLAIFKDITELFENRNEVPIRQIERVYRKALPEPLYITIKKMSPPISSKIMGSLSTYYNDTQVSKYKMYLLTKNNTLKWENIFVLMHESSHLLDYALNPKKTRTYAKVINERGISEHIDKFYKENLYTTGSIFEIKKIELFKIKNKLRKLLKDFTNDDKILIIKYLREALSGELFAYSEENKYIKALTNFPNHPCTIKRNPAQIIDSCMFKEKIEMLKNMAFDIISIERDK